LWVIGSSPTFRTSGTAGANLLSNFIATCQQISVGHNQNYYEFADFREWKRGGLHRIIMKLTKGPPKEDESGKNQMGGIIANNHRQQGAFSLL